MKIRILLLLSFLFSVPPVFSQQSKIIKGKYFVALKNDKGETTDSVFYGLKTVIRGNTVLTFNHVLGCIPDNCPWSFLKERKYLVKDYQFTLVDSLYIKIGTSCGSLFNESADCIAIESVRVNRQRMSLKIYENERTTRIRVPVNYFKKDDVWKIITKKMKSFIRRRECLSLRVE